MVSIPVPDPDFGGGRWGSGGQGLKRVLVVGDERSIVRLIQVNLERQGYQVVSALNGKEALEKVAADLPDLILLDAFMPDMDGFEVLEALKSHPNTRSIPVLVLTTKTEDTELLRSWHGGADAYLAKPFDPQSLLDLIRRFFN